MPGSIKHTAWRYLASGVSCNRCPEETKMKLTIIVALVIVSVSASAQDWAKARLEKSPRHIEWVKVKNGDREVNCSIAYPEVKEKATAVIVIHEIFGLSDWARG